jgi:signal transduction histidine kinase
VERCEGAASFVIVDDGCGFEPRAVDAAHHLGLAIMCRRALRCGGQLCVESAPGAGTQIVATFPLEHRHEGEDER